MYLFFLNYLVKYYFLLLKRPVLQRRSKILDPCQGLPKGKCRFVGEGKAYASSQRGKIFCEVVFLALLTILQDKHILGKYMLQKEETFENI